MIAESDKHADYASLALPETMDDLSAQALSMRMEDFIEIHKVMYKEAAEALEEHGFQFPRVPGDDFQPATLWPYAVAARQFVNNNPALRTTRAYFAARFASWFAIFLRLHPSHGYKVQSKSTQELADRYGRYLLAASLMALDNQLGSQLHEKLFELAAAAEKATAQLAENRKKPKKHAEQSRARAREIHARHPKWRRTQIAEAVAKANKAAGLPGVNANTMSKTLKSTFDELNLPTSKK